MSRNSTATHSMEFDSEPALVAAACIDALSRVGRVCSADRETGYIQGNIPNSFLIIPAKISISISANATGTKIEIATERVEGIFTNGGAQRALSTFLDDLGDDRRLKKTSKAGW